MATCRTQIFRRTGGKQHEGHDRCIKQRKQLEAHARKIAYEKYQRELEDKLQKEALAKKFSGEKDTDRKNRPRKKTKK